LPKNMYPQDGLYHCPAEIADRLRFREDLPAAVMTVKDAASVDAEVRQAGSYAVNDRAEVRRGLFTGERVTVTVQPDSGEHIWLDINCVEYVWIVFDRAEAIEQPPQWMEVSRLRRIE